MLPSLTSDPLRPPLPPNGGSICPKIRECSATGDPIHFMLGFLSVCGTWIYPLLPAFHVHLPCTTLLNSEECALSEKKKKKGFQGRRIEWRYFWLRQIQVGGRPPSWIILNGHISATAYSIHLGLCSAHRAVIFAIAQLSCLW